MSDSLSKHLPGSLPAFDYNGHNGCNGGIVVARLGPLQWAIAVFTNTRKLWIME